VSLPPPPALALLAVYVVERLHELALSSRRIDRMRTASTGWRESGTRAGWRALVLVHAALLALPPAEEIFLGTRAPEPVLWIAIAGAAVAQALRYWSIRTLGPTWNARAVVDPGLGFVESGPYRFVRHPNYLAVLIEFTALPLAFGAWRSWVLLQLVHTPLIALRIRNEERLLGAIPGYSRRMDSRGRLLPRLRRRSV
jgi:methyltransferase